MFRLGQFHVRRKLPPRTIGRKIEFGEIGRESLKVT